MADTQGNGEFGSVGDFWRIFVEFLMIFWRMFVEFFKNLFIIRRRRLEELPSIRDKQRKRGFEATVASKQSQRSDLTSDQKFVAQTTYANHVCLDILAHF